MYIRIDPHVHCIPACKKTIANVFELANKQGVKVIFDMPSTYPPVALDYWVEKRLSMVPMNQKENYFLYLCLTSDENQLKRSVITFNKFKQVIGFKLFAGKSTRKGLAVTGEEEQKRIYRVLTDLGYEGVIAVHCEKESFLKPELWDPLNPISHSFARPKQAEMESIKDQIRFVRNTGFQGFLHIVHVSCLGSVEWIESARRDINITCGVTPYHIMWDNRQLSTPDGVIYKTNPPLRSRPDVLDLRECLKADQIDWIGTDYVSHPIGEKLFPPYLSGYPSLHLYKDFVEKFLPSIGISEEQIRELTHDNICKTFGLKV